MLSVRITNIDYALCPAGPLDHTSLRKVPIIRIYGQSTAGCKTCVHIHQVYPYFYVQYSGPMDPPIVTQYIQRLQHSIDQAVSLSLRQHVHSKRNAFPRYVRSIAIVKAVHFYGFHSSYSPFLKIYIIDPQHMSRIVTILQSGAVMHTKFKIFEAHLNFVLQFLCDFGLYGCGDLEIASAFIREKRLSQLQDDGDDALSAGPALAIDTSIFDLSPHRRESHLPLELDVAAPCILNRLKLIPRNIHHQLTIPAHPLPEEPLVQSVRELWEDERKRRTAKGLPPTPVMPSDGTSTRGDGPTWRAEKRLRSDLEKRVKDEQDALVDQPQPKADQAWEKFVMTAFESVEVLWKTEDKVWRPAGSGNPSSSPFQTSSHDVEDSPSVRGTKADIDEALVGSQAMINLVAAAEAKQRDEEYNDGDTEQEGDEITDALKADRTSNPKMTPSKPAANLAETPTRSASLIKHGSLSRNDYYAANRTPSRQGSLVSNASSGSLAGGSRESTPTAHGHNPSTSTAKKRANPFSESGWSPVKAGGNNGGSTDTGEGGYTPTKSRIIRQHTLLASTSAKPGISKPAARSRKQVYPNNKKTDSVDNALDIAPTVIDSNVPPTIIDLGFVATEIDPRVPPTLDDQGQESGSSSVPISAEDAAALSSQSMPLPGQQLSQSKGHTIVISAEQKDEVNSHSSATSSEVVPPINLESGSKQPISVIDKNGALPSSPITVSSSPDASIINKGRVNNSDGVDKKPTSFRQIALATGEDHDGNPVKKKRLMSFAPSSQDGLVDNASSFGLAENIEGKPRAQTMLGTTPRPLSSTCFTYQPRPPASDSILASFSQLGLPERSYQDPYYSNPKDTPRHGREWAGRLFVIGKSGERAGVDALDKWKTNDQTGCHDWDALLVAMPNIDNVGTSPLRFGGSAVTPRKYAKPEAKDKQLLEDSDDNLKDNDITGWEYIHVTGSSYGRKMRFGGPPGYREIAEWLKSEERAEETTTTIKKQRLTRQSQIISPTQTNRHGFKVAQKRPDKNATRIQQTMSILSVEVLALSRGHLLPDPEQDAVEAVFFCLQDEDTPALTTESSNGSVESATKVAAAASAERRASYHQVCIVVASPYLDPRRIRERHAASDLNPHPRVIEIVDSEMELINMLIDRVMEWDPDVLTGWELESSSWGYLSDRAFSAYGMDLSDQISRLLHVGGKGTGSREYDATHNSTFKVSGRHVLNTWRIMRSELTLGRYTLENVVYHTLHRRIPKYTSETLTSWFKSDVPSKTAQVVEYFMDRTAMVLEVLDQAEVITKNAEFARVFGIDFFAVLSRGSQYKVESVMARIAKPESLMLYSPSKDEVGLQNAAECIPLIMEPLSAYYKSPLVVLDFQSLYPSVMIAYNYCYSTCLGRVCRYNGEYKFGPGELRIPTEVLAKVKDHVKIAPNGMMYVKPVVREGLLGKMLKELLDTRVMVKQAMKLSKNDKALLRLLDARQLSLKFICNVTYGYTSASFSGRMPAVEIADSIVQSGRETLEQAISIINSTTKWGARVVYGDTDSLFVSLEGKSKAQAFQIGNDMADTITSLNPRPVKLKFEKVYFPCLLMAKKRYVGFKYEHPDDKEPVFDAKGIETVRRDGIPAGQKMVETGIKILFRTQDLSEVKEYCKLSWTKLLDGQVSIYDFIFSKEVRLGRYSDKVAPPPGVVVATRLLARDRRCEPQYGDRIPYVITRNLTSLKSRLIDRAFSPQELLHDKQQYQLDAVYYIEHQLIPPLQRVFDLVGADVKAWYEEMPKTVRADAPDSLALQAQNTSNLIVQKPKFTIDAHFQTNVCIACGGKTTEILCLACRSDPESTIFALQSRLRIVQSRAVRAQQVCASCTASPAWDEIKCESLDCRWLFERYKVDREAQSLDGITKLVEEAESWGTDPDEEDKPEEGETSDSEERDSVEFETLRTPLHVVSP